MGFSLGSFLGGAADGYRKENADLRDQAKQKMLQDAVDKQQAQETLRTKAIAESSDVNKNNLLVSGAAEPDPSVSSDPTSAPDNVFSNAVAGIQPSTSIMFQPQAAPLLAAQGITPTQYPLSDAANSRPPFVASPISLQAPKQSPSGASTPADPNAAQPPDASSILTTQGIRQPTSPVSVTPADPSQPSADAPATTGSQPATKQPVYRQATLDDSIAHSGDLMNRFLNYGLLEDAAKVAPLHNAMIAEKLQSETATRMNSVRDFMFALQPGVDNKTLLATGQKLTGMIPDGQNLNSISRLPDGTFKVQYGDNPEQVMNTDQLTNMAYGAASPDIALSHIQQVQTNAFAAAKAKQEADSKKVDQTETNRHNLASEGIALKAADKTSAAADAPTSEMKNTQYFGDPKKTPAENLVAYRKMIADKGINFHPTNSGGVVTSNPATGEVISIDPDGNRKTLIAANGSAPPPAAPPAPGAKLAPDGKWYVQGANGKYSRVDN